MTGSEQDWRLKFRRVLLLHAGEAHDWLEVLKRFANDVTEVHLDNYFAADLLQLPADCMIVDSRIPDHDITGVGYAVAVARQRMLPTLTFYDDRPYWEVDHLVATAGPADREVRYAERTVLEELERFLSDTEPVDFEAMDRLAPWLLRPQTVTLEQTLQANALGSFHPQQLS